MNKSLYEYRWFKFYSESAIGIRVRGKTFYPTKNPVKSCKKCYFFHEKHTLDGQRITKCDLRIDLEPGLDKGMTSCFPCKPTAYVGREDDIQCDSLRTEILKKCIEEDNIQYEHTQVDDLRH